MIIALTAGTLVLGRDDAFCQGNSKLCGQSERSSEEEEACCCCDLLTQDVGGRLGSFKMLYHFDLCRNRLKGCDSNRSGHASRF